MMVECPLHGEHEAYKGYYECPAIRMKAKLLAEDYGVEERNIISTGKITEPIRAERLGLVERQGELV